MVVFKQVLDGHQGRSGDVSALRLLVEVHLVEALGELGHQGGQNVAVIMPEVPVLPDVVLQCVVVHPLEEGLHVTRVAGLRVDEPVLAGIRVGGRQVSGCAHPAVDLDAVGVSAQVGQYVGEHLLDRHLYVLDAARGVPILQRGETGHSRVLGRQLVSLWARGAKAGLMSGSP